jgi:hypothetical protein
MIEFNLEKYESGDYDVVSRDNKEVIISGINKDASNGHQIIGWYSYREGDNEIYGWDLDGKLYGWKGTDYPYDLFLTLKTL